MKRIAILFILLVSVLLFTLVYTYQPTEIVQQNAVFPYRLLFILLGLGAFLVYIAYLNSSTKDRIIDEDIDLGPEL